MANAKIKIETRAWATKTLPKKQTKIKPSQTTQITKKQSTDNSLTWRVEHAYSFLILLYALSSEEIRQSHGSEETPAGLEVQGAYDISITLLFFFLCAKEFLHVCSLIPLIIL